jgi:hypothetical protein
VHQRPGDTPQVTMGEAGRDRPAWGDLLLGLEGGPHPAGSGPAELGGALPVQLRHFHGPDP